ncbi:hypothetical protein [Xanthomonas phaseoli]|uniref:hypothetical protein n=1 Tax=Xanthomonas phaseoli TaxID=1985254 RepID=UPI00037EF339|nr:hypothetical protein [Xanthomonas phaseoli]KUF34291.1 hypothetical protein AO826_21080 [Xanthomonas phaseoli pv. manihotis]MBO9722465.1 hypothetical protein [Xanthomonas phaseoli pv. manihotis]
MWLSKDSGIDWTAIAALIALGIWLVDGWRRRRERAATRRLLAQIMTTPVGVAQIDIARFRVSVVPSSGDTTNILNLIDSQACRAAFAAKAFEVKLDLPSQFLEKAGLFGERTSNRLALALSQTSRLHMAWKLAADIPDGVDEKELHNHVHHALEQIQATERAIGEAFNAVVADGQASP